MQLNRYRIAAAPRSGLYVIAGWHPGYREHIKIRMLLDKQTNNAAEAFRWPGILTTTPMHGLWFWRQARVLGCVN